VLMIDDKHDYALLNVIKRTTKAAVASRRDYSNDERRELSA
jgi:hypothetical protein